MVSVFIKNAVGGLDKLLSNVRRALWEIGRDQFVGRDEHDDRGSYPAPHAARAWNLEELHDTLLVVLEAGKMPDSKASLIQAWPKFTSAKRGLSSTEIDQEYGSCTSPAFT